MVMAVMALLTATTGVDAQGLKDKYSSEHPLKVSCDIEFYPFEWLNDDGDPTGLNVELITAALNDMGAKCVFEVSDKHKAVSDFEAFETNLMLSPLVEKIPGVYYGKYEVATYRVVLAQRKDARQIAKLRS